MTDWNEADSTTTAVEDPIASAAERGIEHVRTIAAEMVEAGRSAIQSVLDEQKAGAARQVAAVAEATRSAAQSLDRSKLPTLARYAEEAAGGIEEFGTTLRDRNWSELIGETEDFARRRPALFAAGIVLAGFLLARFLRASSRRPAAAPANPAMEMGAIERESEAVTAAVESGSGENPFAEPATGISGTGTQELPR
ncbi:MAG TPA: hypothetical protein VJ770_01850 [Stellaceae bacterium]|nr:hypothetical protein [Stellaceae bacterium]